MQSAGCVGITCTSLWELGLRESPQENDDTLATAAVLSSKLFFVSDPGVSDLLPGLSDAELPNIINTTY